MYDIVVLWVVIWSRFNESVKKNVHLRTYSNLTWRIYFWNSLHPFPIEYFIILISIVEKIASWKLCAELLHRPKDSMYCVPLSQQYTVYKSICQETVNVSGWDWNSSFLLSLSHNARPTVGRRLKLALELNQASLSPKELINAPLKENLWRNPSWVIKQ